MPVLNASVCNCLIGGEGIARELADHWATGIRLSLGRYNIEIRQRRSAFGPNRNELKGTNAHTTDIIIKNLRTSEYSTGVNVVKDICVLLSFATMSQVRPFAYAFEGHGGSYNVQCITLYFRPPLETNNGSLIRQFLEETWDSYRSLKRIRKLPAAINYPIAAELPLQPMEARLLLAFVTLENLKDTFARSRGIRRPNLRRDLKEMLKSVGMKTGVERIVRLRNEIVHEGLAQRDFEAQWKVYERCQDLVREYLIRLLGYTGEYDTYSGYD